MTTKLDLDMFGLSSGGRELEDNEGNQSAIQLAWDSPLYLETCLEGGPTPGFVNLVRDPGEVV